MSDKVLDNLRLDGNKLPIYRNNRKKRRLLTNPALPAFLCTMPAVVAVLAGMTGIRAGAGGRKDIDRNLIDEKNRQHDLSQDGK
jgi:hypothetical protein